MTRQDPHQIDKLTRMRKARRMNLPPMLEEELQKQQRLRQATSYGPDVERRVRRLPPDFNDQPDDRYYGKE